jgi:hypothetical protein
VDSEITAEMLRQLYETEWHEPAVISVDAVGWHELEPASAALAGGREVVITQGWLDVRFGGRPLDAADFATLAAELTLTTD